jgi:hypothetical protein
LLSDGRLRGAFSTYHSPLIDGKTEAPLVGEVDCVGLVSSCVEGIMLNIIQGHMSFQGYSADDGSGRPTGGQDA